MTPRYGFSCTGKTYVVSIYGPTSEADYCLARGKNGISITRVALSSTTTTPTLSYSVPGRPNVLFNLTAPVTLTGNPNMFYHIVLEATGSTTQNPSMGAMAVWHVLATRTLQDFTAAS